MCGGIHIRDDFGKTVMRRKGRGWSKDRFGKKRPCAACGGRPAAPGEEFPDGLPFQKGSGEVERDAMDATGARVGSVATVATARPRDRVTCDRCAGAGVWKGERCALCDGDGKRDLHAFNLAIDTASNPDPLEDAITRRDKSGSYHELDLALAGLSKHVNKPQRFQPLTSRARQVRELLDAVYLPPAERDYADLDTEEQQLVELALAYIESRMPDPIRVPGAVVANDKVRRERRTKAKGPWADPRALAQRDTEIRKLARQGRPAPWIAQEYGISPRLVWDIIRGEEGAA